MTLRLIELNDSGVRVFREGKIVCESPGVAIVERNKVITGTEAQVSVQLNPRAVNTRRGARGRRASTLSRARTTR